MLKLYVTIHALCSYPKHFTLIQIVLIRTQKHEYDIVYEVFCSVRGREILSCFSEAFNGITPIRSPRAFRS